MFYEKSALTRAAKAAKAKVKVEGSVVKVEGSNAAWSSPAESKEDGDKADGGLRRSQRLRDNKSKK